MPHCIQKERPHAFSPKQQVDLAGNAFSGPVVAAVLTVALGSYDWAAGDRILTMLHEGDCGTASSTESKAEQQDKGDERDAHGQSQALCSPSWSCSPARGAA